MTHEIATLRARLGLSQVALAALLGVDKGTIWRAENGKLQLGEPTLRLARLHADGRVLPAAEPEPVSDNAA